MRVPARDDVRARYLACGFTLDKDISLPEDHLSFELEFMALLCEHKARKRVKAARAGKRIAAAPSIPPNAPNRVLGRREVPPKHERPEGTHRSGASASP